MLAEHLVGEPDLEGVAVVPDPGRCSSSSSPLTVPSTRSCRGPGSTLTEPRPRFSMMIARTPTASKVRAVIGPSPGPNRDDRARGRAGRPAAARGRRRSHRPRTGRSDRTLRTDRTDRSRWAGPAGRAAAAAGPLAQRVHHRPQQPGVGRDVVAIGLFVDPGLDRSGQPEADPGHGLVGSVPAFRRGRRRRARRVGWSGSSRVGSGAGVGTGTMNSGSGPPSGARPTPGRGRR